MKRFLWLGLVAFLFLICLGCGDTFRPVIIPNPPKFPDPRASHSVMSVNDNGTDRGSNTEINVSGDTVTGVAKMETAPVHAVQVSASQVLVVNHGMPGMLDDSLTRVSFSGTTITGTSTISLPPDSAPSLVATTETTQAYVLLTGTVPPSVGVVSLSTSSVNTTIPVGTNPMAILETVDKNKLYVANQGSSSVSNFNTIDRTPRNNPAIAVGSPPVWLAARSDSQRVFVLEQNGTLATLDTTSNAGPDSVIDTKVVAPGATIMLYDGLKNRLYIPGNDPGTGAPQLVVVDVGPSVPQVLARVALPAPGVGVAALPDGTRVYAGSTGDAQTTTIGTISSVSGNGGTATYTFDPLSVTGPAPQAGMTLAISGAVDGGFNGTVIVTAASAGTFQADNTTVADSSDPRTATGANFFPQVTVINTSSNLLKATITMPAVPAGGLLDPPVCAATRFRFVMAAAGDSSRAYMSSCDAGGVNIINTFTDTFQALQKAPASARAPIPPDTQPPPQNPVFLIAGP